MLNLIYGSLGSGKTYYCDTLILDTLKKGKRVTLIVPEQEAIEAENRIYDRALNFGAPLEKLSVLSFRRLANSAFRTHGGIEYDNLGDSGRLILLYRILYELSSELSIYGNFKDRSLIELLLSVCTELKRYCISPEQLATAADNTQSPHLKSKLSDISKIYGKYCAELSGQYADSSDDINRLADIYEVSGAPAAHVFFIDSFNGFTSPELRVIASLIKSCEVTATLTVPSKTGSIGYYTLEKTANQLTELAKENNALVNILTKLEDNPEYRKKEFSLIKDKLFDSNYYSPAEYGSDSIELCCCTDAFMQAEYIAKRICELIRNGARYKDIAVITRNADRYDGVLDAVFERYGIPIFLSKRSKLTDTAIYKAISSALQIVSEHFNTEDIMSYIKSGICGFTAEDIDIIESYVYLWKLDRKRWTDNDDWSMNPNGFTDGVQAGTQELLIRINAIKKRIITPLTELASSINDVSALDACKALYSFILKSGIAEHYSKTTEPSEITAYNTFISMLDTLALVTNGLTVDARALSSLLYLMAKNTDYGAIPSTFDRVTAGDASIIRCTAIKHVFLTDCENGAFPAAVNDDSFFSDTEKKLLSAEGINISPDVSEKNDLEAFYFLRSACGPAESLTLTYCAGKNNAHPSFAFKRISELFPANKIKRITETLAPADRIQSQKSFLEIYKSYRLSKYYPVIEKLAKEFNIADDIPSNIPLMDIKANISAENINALFGAEIGMSYTRFETYVKCPFAYFCKYVLGLKEKKYGYFSQADMGTYIHRILEKSLASLFADGSIESKTDADIDANIKTAFDEVVSAIIGNDTAVEGKRFDALLSRLSRTLKFISKNIVTEFKNSDFIPKFFELEIGKRAGAITPLKIKIDDVSSMYINGKIDRVDTYENDGKLYVRVLDYKSGNTEHALSNVKYGLDTQMLLYLFSIWKEGGAQFSALMGKPNSDIVPAGVLYQRASLPVVSSTHPISNEIAMQNASGELVRNGILLDDAKILDAMEHDIKGCYMPVRIENDVISSQKDVLVTVEGFEQLYEDIQSVLSEHGKKMKSGYASAAPLSAPKTDPCAYCKLKPICRNTNRRCDDE